jgi:hypothetical protein
MFFILKHDQVHHKSFTDRILTKLLRARGLVFPVGKNPNLWNLISRLFKAYISYLIQLSGSYYQSKGKSQLIRG